MDDNPFAAPPRLLRRKTPPRKPQPPPLPRRNRCVRSAELATQFGVRFGPVLKEGHLRKVTKEGPRLYQFILTVEALTYTPGLTQLSLETVTTAENKNGFEIRSPATSFVLITDRRTAKEWRTTIDTAANDRREKFGCALPPELAPVLKNDGDCGLCGAKFGVLRRKHHCHKCGKLVCHSCSGETIRLPHLERDLAFRRVCDRCYADYADSRVYGVDRYIPPTKKFIPKLPPRRPIEEEIKTPTRPAPQRPPLPPRRGK